MKPIKKAVLLIVVCLVVCSIWFTASTYAEVPRLINYQGQLTDSQGKPLNGSYSVTIKIYDTEAGGSPIWQETHSNLTITRGIFNLMLGGITPLNLAFDKQYWLTPQVGSDAEMAPRQRLASSAYAFTAENGVPRGAIIMWSGSIADIPSGWALCDGTNGTPDLRDKFIVCARQDEGGIAKTNVTGSLTRNGNSVLPTHSHGAGSLTGASAGDHTHTMPHPGGAPATQGWGLSWDFQHVPGTRSTDPGGSHTHAITGLTASTGSGTEVIPPYYALAFIIKL